jgi:hypothetical protein
LKESLKSLGKASKSLGEMLFFNPYPASLLIPNSGYKVERIQYKAERIEYEIRKRTTHLTT